MSVTQACVQNWINLDKIVRGNLVCALSYGAYKAKQPCYQVQNREPGLEGLDTSE